eukprot:6233942-Prymnesium_polylepis.1
MRSTVSEVYGGRPGWNADSHRETVAKRARNMRIVLGAARETGARTTRAANLRESRETLRETITVNARETFANRV